MNILDDARSTWGWITAIIENRWCQAKVYDESSSYGINNGRVSKLAVAKEGIAALGAGTGLPYFDNLDFNYDRGLDFDNLKDGVLDRIVNQLEALPKTESSQPPDA